MIEAGGSISIRPLAGLPEIRPGDDLAALLAGALAPVCAPSDKARRDDKECDGLLASDIVVVTSKIVSKTEGRFVDLATVVPGAEARRLGNITRKDPRLVELVLAESVAVIRAVPHVLITRHRLGLVMANAGIDESNLGPEGGERALLLPVDPDASAIRLRADMAARCGIAPAIILADSFGRPWRMGVVNIAIGAAGLPALIDRRGDPDRDGRILEVTQIALGDIVASAAGLVMGEGAEGVPAAIVRGYNWAMPENDAAALVRPTDQDLFA